MNKSQNTKNEQQKDLCITSEQLTEQWKKGELPEGFYYIKVKEVMANDPLLADCVEGLSYTYFLDYEDYVTEVLAPVPSYDEWQATETSIAYNELLEENTKLKELLEECKEFFYENLIGTEFHFSCVLGSDIKKQSCIKSLSKLKTKIDNAIGEK